MINCSCRFSDAVLTIDEMEHLIATWIVERWQNRRLGAQPVPISRTPAWHRAGASTTRSVRPHKADGTTTEPLNPFDGITPLEKRDSERTGRGCRRTGARRPVGGPESDQPAV
jgi:hypothetical protein